MRAYAWSALAAICLSYPLQGAGAAATQPAPDPFGRVLRPAAIVQISGLVTGADGLANGRADVTLTMTAGQPAPTVVLDYGRDVGGFPVVDVAKVQGAPLLREIFSESRAYLFPTGDGAPGFVNPPADASRVDDFVIRASGRLENHQMQGGERYEAITLASPGSVTLHLAGIRSMTASPVPTDNTGHFESSDATLNRIWDLGARTLQICEIPAGSLPPLLTAALDGLRSAGGSPAVYQQGRAWSSYVATVDMKLERNEATLLLRSSLFHTINVSFHATGDRLGDADTILITDVGIFGQTPVATMKIPAGLPPGGWHTVRVALAGDAGTIALDGKRIGAFKAIGDAGSVGFSTPADGAAVFRNLLIVGADGKTLLRSSLAEPGEVSRFAAGQNRLPVIVDGGKRDRLVWLGDMAGAAPTVYYSSGEYQYVAGTLELLGAFQTSAGEVSTNTTPLIDTTLGESGPLPDGAGFYSLPYSIHYVNVAYDYLLYSGDSSLARRLWPVIKREMSYLAANTSPNHLLQTDRSDGMDWALNTETGNVTAFNAWYYAALVQAARMARTFEEPAYAAQLDALAGQVKDAINATLFDQQAGVYDVGTDHRGTVAQDANVLPVLFGIARPDRAGDMLDKMSRALDTPMGPLGFSDGRAFTDVISPFMSGFEVEARFERRDATGALALIRKVWGRMAEPSPFNTGGAFEALGRDGLPQMPSRSLAHGWSTAPTAALSEYVLGVRPVAPGFAKWSISPQFGDLQWAKGTVPTPHGPIGVSWALEEGGGALLDIRVPEGTSGSVEVPAAGVRRALINGKLAAAKGADGNMLFENLTRGRYHIELDR